MKPGIEMAAKHGRKGRNRVETATAAQVGPARGSSAVSPQSKPSDTSISLVKSLAYGPALWVSLALTVVSVFIYASVRNHHFVAWDDPEYLSENPLVTAGLTWDGIRWAFTTGHMGNWHPLTWLSYMLGVQLFGTAAGPHLVINLVFHILNALLLFGLLHKMTGALWRSAFVAALFATHPLHVESVAWVSERKDVLSTFFELLALWAYLEYTRRPGTFRYLTVLSMFILALMAKPMAVTLPLLLLLLDYWPLGRLAHEAGTQGQANITSSRQQHSAPWLIREKLPLFAVALIFSVVALLAQQRAGAVAVLAKVPLNLRLGNALVTYVAYIGKMLWPANLAALYPLYPLQPLVVAGSALTLATLSLFVIRQAARHPWLPLGWLWYLITLLPVIGLVQVGSQSMADRYTYVPLIGLFIALTWEITDLAGSLPYRTALLGTAAGILILACTIAAHAQVQYWEEDMTLWSHALEAHVDSDTAQRLLANALVRQGRRQEAMAHYAEALRQNPDNAEAHTGFGLALSDEGKYSEAITHYSEALRLKPDLFEAHNDFAGALASQGRVEEAISQYYEALRIKPYVADAHNNLGVALARQGNVGEATSQFLEALRLQPGNPDAHNNLGILLANQGRIDEAIAHFQTALQLKPEFESARNNLTFALARRQGVSK
ncbi:MAG: tetratricopeptide repeat protein [Bryobacteraceae bacterium]|jgi:Flp pilus assembly protein TadD